MYPPLHPDRWRPPTDSIFADTAGTAADTLTGTLYFSRSVARTSRVLSISLRLENTRAAIRG
jgi:hypothetical protein